MLSRRDLLASGAAFTQVRREAADAAQRCDDNGPELNSIRDALRELRHPAASPHVAQVRERQRAFLKQNQRFPDFIDVGIRVWEGLQDWHVENRQELKISRSADGRYIMEFMLTHLVLRPELPEGDIGLAYDR